MSYVYISKRGEYLIENKGQGFGHRIDYYWSEVLNTATVFRGADIDAVPEDFRVDIAVVAPASIVTTVVLESC